jgi:hypothetical protein
LATILGGAVSGSVLDLGTGLTVGSSETRKLLVRDCYIDFVDLLVEMYQPGLPATKVVVAGTPGIGMNDLMEL